MWKLKAKIIFFVAFICVYLVTGCRVNATELKNNNEVGSLEIYHSYNEKPLEGVEFSVYKVANLNKDFQYELTDAFKDYPIDFNNIKDKTDWYLLIDTLSSYVKVDNIKEEAKLKTDSKGIALFNNMDLGLYLVIGETVIKDNMKYVTKPFLVSIPTIDSNSNNYIYNVKVKTKTEKIPINTINIIVQKKWINDNKQIRPTSINVTLYKNNVFYEKVILNEANNWQYKWENLDNEADWTIIEDVPTDYKVTYEKYEGVIIVSNTYSGTPPGKLPYTGELIFKSILINILGIVLIVTGTYIRRRYKEQH